MTLATGFGFDFDTGTRSMTFGASGIDIYVESGFLNAGDGAAISVEEVGQTEDCGFVSATYTISLSEIPDGGTMCFLTSEQNIASALVVDVSSSALSLVSVD